MPAPGRGAASLLFVHKHVHDTWASAWGHQLSCHQCTPCEFIAPAALHPRACALPLNPAIPRIAPAQLLARVLTPTLGWTLVTMTSRHALGSVCTSPRFDVLCRAQLVLSAMASLPRLHHFSWLGTRRRRRLVRRRTSWSASSGQHACLPIANVRRLVPLPYVMLAAHGISSRLACSVPDATHHPQHPGTVLTPAA